MQGPWLRPSSRACATCPVCEQQWVRPRHHKLNKRQSAFGWMAAKKPAASDQETSQPHTAVALNPKLCQRRLGPATCSLPFLGPLRLLCLLLLWKGDSWSKAPGPHAATLTLWWVKRGEQHLPPRVAEVIRYGESSDFGSQNTALNEQKCSCGVPLIGRRGTASPREEEQQKHIIYMDREKWGGFLKAIAKTHSGSRQRNRRMLSSKKAEQTHHGCCTVWRHNKTMLRTCRTQSLGSTNVPMSTSSRLLFGVYCPFRRPACTGHGVRDRWGGVNCSLRDANYTGFFSRVSGCFSDCSLALSSSNFFS